MREEQGEREKREVMRKKKKRESRNLERTKDDGELRAGDIRERECDFVGGVIPNKARDGDGDVPKDIEYDVSQPRNG